jgi:hypothetical protein
MSCRNHGDRPVYEEDMGDQFCGECFFKAWNAGAAWADANWSNNPAPQVEWYGGYTVLSPDHPVLLEQRMRDQHTIDRSKE